MGNNRPAFFDTLINLKNASKFGAFLQFPIRLSPQTPYSVGRAALVFVSPHVIDPAENIAEFGWNSGGIAVEDAGIYYEQHPPHSDAYVVAWFKSPSVGTKFGIEFLCKGLPGPFLLPSVE